MDDDNGNPINFKFEALISAGLSSKIQRIDFLEISG